MTKDTKVLDFQGLESKNPSSATLQDNSLLRKVEKNFEKHLFMSSCRMKDFFSHSPTIQLLLAVSGGIDSQVMLHSIFYFCKNYPIKLSVVTINHNIREESETRKDAELVYDFSTNILHIPCTIITIEKDGIAKLSKERGRGTEEAARFLRYLKIEEHANKIGASYVLFAHNRDDQLETLLHHFLQGAAAGISGFSSSGIRQCGPYPSQQSNTTKLQLFRPLLTVSRSEIEDYAQSFSIPYREDSTNAETKYFRNRIRHTLTPILHEYFEGWDTAVLKGAEKAFEEAIFIESLVDNCAIQDYNGGVRIALDDFFALSLPVRVRTLYKAFERAHIEGRISYEIVKSACDGKKRVEGPGLEIFQKSGYLVVRRYIKRNQSPFRIEVSKEGMYTQENCNFTVQSTMQKRGGVADIDKGKDSIGVFLLPLIIRSKKDGETILTADRKHKSVKKIFSEWKVDVQHRHLIPIIEYEGEAVCIWGSLFGYPNWYVKQHAKLDKAFFVHYKRNNNE